MKNNAKKYISILYSTPFGVLLIIFALFPFVLNLAMSFTNYGLMRQDWTYAPDILQDLLEKLEEISSRKDLLPKSTLAQAVGYALNEYNAICDIFKRGDTALDNNYIERIQRYISLSRRNSMFFGSHEGASRAAILYSIAISCRLNGINLFEYICDVIEKTVEWQPNTPLEKYRDLLPDRWKKQ